jgi:hypothetical protein
MVTVYRINENYAVSVGAGPPEGKAEEGKADGH